MKQKRRHYSSKRGKLADKIRLIPIASMYGIFTYIYHKNQPKVGKYTSPMDGKGFDEWKQQPPLSLFHLSDFLFETTCLWIKRAMSRYSEHLWAKTS